MGHRPKVWNRRDPKCPTNGIYVGRPTKWGNPFTVHHYGREGAIKRYRERLLYDRPDLVEAARRELRGFDLICWCAPEACHAEVLLELANK